MLWLRFLLLSWYWSLGPFFQFSFWKKSSKGKNIAMQTTKSNFKFRTYSQCLNEQQQQINIRSTDNCHINTNNNLHTHKKKHMKCIIFCLPIVDGFPWYKLLFFIIFFCSKTGESEILNSTTRVFFLLEKKLNLNLTKIYSNK